MNSRDKYLVDLARFVPVLTGPQIVQEYFSGSNEAMRRAMRSHLASGLIICSTEIIRPRSVVGPLLTVAPGQRHPSSHAIAYLAGKLWSNSLQTVLVVRATDKLMALYGGQRRALVSTHLSHEVALAGVFLFRRAHSPSFEWDLIRSGGDRGALPDAVSADAVIELIGRYNGTTVASKLGLAAECKLELW